MLATHRTVTAMTTNTEPRTRYSALLERLHHDSPPMATINDRAMTLTFAFDDSHSYTLIGPLLDELSNHDQELLEAETYGGRLARHRYLISSLQTLAQLTDVVEAPQQWKQMINLATNLNDAGDDDTSFETFADLVDDALLALQPEAEDDYETAFVEMQELDDSGAPIPHSVDWAHINLEFFMAYTGGTVDRIQYTYPGHGQTAELAVACDDGTVDRFELTAPANKAASALMRHYYECHDALNATPVMSALNALPKAEANAKLATLRTDAGAVPLDEHTCPKDDAGNGSCVLLAAH